MTQIDLKYFDLSANYTDVISEIDNLMTIIENINTEFQNLSNDWEGSLSSVFLDFVSKVSEYSKQNVLNFKNTEEYKKISINMFQKTESTNSSAYKK